MTKKGQASTELVFMLPVFALLAAAIIYVCYICFQGIKVQQAANLAARIQGQERVGGGTTHSNINYDNGLDGDHDTVPAASSSDLEQMLTNDPNALSSFQHPPDHGVYQTFYKAVQSMFTAGEQKKLFIPPPIQPGSGNTDEVEVVRILNPPKILNWQLPPITLSATAYGGEDSNMYGLPRWGTLGNGGKFYKTAITNPDGDR